MDMGILYQKVGRRTNRSELSGDVKRVTDSAIKTLHSVDDWSRDLISVNVMKTSPVVSTAVTVPLPAHFRKLSAVLAIDMRTGRSGRPFKTIHGRNEDENTCIVFGNTLTIYPRAPHYEFQVDYYAWPEFGESWIAEEYEELVIEYAAFLLFNELGYDGANAAGQNYARLLRSLRDSMA